MSACPNCGVKSVDLIKVDAGLKLHLASTQQFENKPVPDAVCENCHNVFTSSLSQGALLRRQQSARENNKMMLWKSRVNLVKQAKALMGQKNFSEAALTYEKYLRILEIVYDKKAGQLTPELFKEKGEQPEMTVVASVYWDLMRIYDSSPRYADRQLKAAEKLAQFARFTPIFPDIVRKAEVHTRTGKNPAMFKRFLSLSNKTRPRCFIATSAFAYETNSTVLDLCRFRDQFLAHKNWGRAFIFTYYKFSPAIAEALDRAPFLKPLVRPILRLAASCVRRLRA